MKKYNKFDIDRVKSAADIRDFIPGLSGRGATQYCECPECHKSGRNKGLCVTHKTNMDIAKCFSCGFTINGAIDAVQYYDKVEFIDALQIVASRYNILLEAGYRPKPRESKAVVLSLSTGSQWSYGERCHRKSSPRR